MTTLPPPAPGLELGSDDRSACSLVNLLLRVGHVLDPSLSEAPVAELDWAEFYRLDLQQPGVQRSSVGRLSLRREFELQDGIGGPVECFSGFAATVHGLPPGCAVAARWKGGASLELAVTAPAGTRARLEALAPGASWRFTEV